MSFPLFVLVAGVLAVASVIGAVRLDRVYAVPLAIAGAAAVMFIKGILYINRYGDDAYITLRYSRNLAAGIGPVWNPGQHVEGYTSFLWMGTLAGMHKIGIDLVGASLLLAYLSLLASLLIAWKIWELWAREAGGAIAMPAVLAVALLTIGLSDGFVTWGMSGLETPLAAALLIGIAYLYFREARGAAMPWSAVAAVAAAMTRPEMMLVAGITGAFTLRDAIERRQRVDVRRVVLWVTIFVVLYGAYFIWRYSYYGYIFPNTYYVKSGSNIDFYRRGFYYAKTNLVHQWFLPFLGGACVLLVERGGKVRRDATYILVVIAAWLAGVVLEGGDAYAHARFLAPLAPLLFLAGVCGAALLLRRLLSADRRFVAVGATLALLVGFALARSSIDPGLGADRRADIGRKATGLWLRQNVPADYKVAVFAAGAVPYYSQLPSLDLLGLTDETIAHTKVPNFGNGVPAHEKYNTSYVLNTVRPEIIVVGDPAPIVQPRGLLQDNTIVIGRNDLFQNPRTYELYEPVAFALDQGWLTFLQRKDTLGRVETNWTESGGFKYMPAKNP